MVDSEIKGDDKLLRRVLFLDPSHIKPDGRPSSFAFNLKRGEDGLSVDIERLTTFEKSIQDIQRFRLYSLEVQLVNKEGLQCEAKPVEGNNAHALILGVTKSLARKLADIAQRVPYPD